MDVEVILNQIRERVVTEENTRTLDARPTNTEAENGSASVANHDEALSRMESHLAVTSRAWDRLPPIFSNRQGLFARIELWIKKASKPFTRWFTWEQINFNRAANEALVGVVEMLRSNVEEIATLRAQLAAEMHQLRSTVDGQAVELRKIETRLDQIEARLGSSVNSHSQLVAEHTKLAEQVIELGAAIREEQRASKSEYDQEINRRLTALAADLKEEQRVCFRQLSLEASESAVLEDRARRSLLARLEKLEAALKATNR